MRIGVSGVCGKMGRRIAALAEDDKDVEVAAGLENGANPEVGKELHEVMGAGAPGVKITADAAAACEGVGCLIEFTLPAPTLEHLETCRAKKVPMVIGTTGFDEAGEKKIAEAAADIPIVFSPNMAVGVNLLFNIVREAARVLGGSFSIKVDETHHVHKKDSPSGTAKMIGRVIKEASGVDAPIEAFREGEVIGNHGIVFDGEYEELEIRHNAKTRDVFAAGAITAAKFLATKEPGLYDMADVLGLKR